MYYGNAKTRIVHYQQCTYGQRMKKDGSLRLREFSTFEEAKDNNYRRCKCCDPMLNPVRRIDSYAKQFCKENSICYKHVKGELIITTPYSEWIVHVDYNRKYNLFHRNTMGNTNHYHVHAKQYANIFSVFKYVYDHDQFRLENPLVMPQRKKKKKLHPPKMGAQGCRAKMRRYKEKKRKQEAREVLRIIESLTHA